MQFFRYEGYYPEEAEQRYSVREMRDLLKKQAMKIDAYLQPIRREAFLCVGSVDEDGVTVVALLRSGDDAQRLIETFFKTMELPIANGRLEEITLHVARGLLQNAARSGFIEDDEDILERFELHRLNARFGKGICFSEKMIEPRYKDAIYREAQRYLSKERFSGGGPSRAVSHTDRFRHDPQGALGAADGSAVRQQAPRKQTVLYDQPEARQRSLSACVRRAV